MSERKRVRIVVKEIHGACPIFCVGDRIYFDGAELMMDRSDAYCVWASASFLPYLIPCRYEIPSSELGFGKEDESYLVQCLDPGPPHTSGGTVVFEIKREE